MCEYCNQELESGSRFCRFCGSNLDDYRENQTIRKKICNNCGSENFSDAAFCNVCGKPVGSISQQSIPVYNGPERFRNENVSYSSVPAKKCQYCGNFFDSSLDYCTLCGKKVNRIKNSSYNYQRNNPNNNYYQETPKKNHSKIKSEYSTNYLLILLFIVTLLAIFTPVLFFLCWLFVIASSIAVYYDAKEIIVKKPGGEKMLSALTWTPLSWSLITLFFWIIGLPLYILKRREIFELNSYEGGYGNNFENYYQKRSSTGIIETIIFFGPIAIITIPFLLFLLYLLFIYLRLL